LNSFEFLSSSETFSDFLYTRSITGTTDIFGTTKRTYGIYAIVSYTTFWGYL